MTATMIVALLSLSLYRFLTGQLAAIQLSKETVEGRESLQAVVSLLQEELAALNPRDDNQLLGEAKRFHSQSSDEITWLTTAGPGVLTSAAPGQYRVTLAVQPISDRSPELELGLRRQRVDRDAQKNADFYLRGTADQKYNWLSLARPIAALEFRYYDPRLSQWVDRWTDPKRLPTLVRIRLSRTPDEVSTEAVLTIPASRLQ